MANKHLAHDSEEKLRADMLQQEESLKIFLHQETEKIKDSILKKYDNLMARHSEIINEMVDRRKKELAESQFLYESAKTNMAKYETRMN